MSEQLEIKGVKRRGRKPHPLPKAERLRLSRAKYLAKGKKQFAAVVDSSLIEEFDALQGDRREKLAAAMRLYIDLKRGE